MDSNNKTNILKYKKSDAQFAYEDDNIIQPIKDRIPKANSGRTHSIKLPKYISFVIQETTRTLQIYIQEQEGICDGQKVILNATCNNMQSDNAAFEGWAICLKAWLPEYIEGVNLKWDSPNDKFMTPNNKQHYNRFLYRALRFSQQYSWFSIDDNNKWEVDGFKGELYDLQNNYYSKKPELKGNLEILSETSVEYLLANKLSDQMKSYFDLDVIDRQFPVGVKRLGKQFFTGGMSAIDLWGMKKDVLSIIELKYNGGETKNKKVGIISELFMYSNIMRDIISGIIARPERTSKQNEESFYLRHQSFHSLNAFMLSDEYHPLVDNEMVFEILNNYSYSNGVRVTFAKISYKLTANKLEIQ
jgi:hypothetical protein